MSDKILNQDDNAEQINQIDVSVSTSIECSNPEEGLTDIGEALDPLEVKI